MEVGVSILPPVQRRKQNGTPVQESSRKCGDGCIYPTSYPEEEEAL